jgi:hypothetical protein
MVNLAHFGNTVSNYSTLETRTRMAASCSKTDPTPPRCAVHRVNLLQRRVPNRVSLHGDLRIVCFARFHRNYKKNEGSNNENRTDEKHFTRLRTLE